MTRVSPTFQRARSESAYRERVAATRRVALGVAGLDLLFTALGYVDLHTPRRVGEADLATLLAYECGLVLLLVAYALLLGAKPRPWLSAAVACAVVADQVVWLGPQLKGGVGLGPAATCFGPLLAGWLALSALWTAWTEWGQLRSRPETASHAGLAVGLAVAAWVAAAYGHAARPRRHLVLGASVRQDVEQCRADLRAWYLAEKAYRRDAGRYDERFDAIHLGLPVGNHYAYFAAPKGPLIEHSRVVPERPAGATGIQAQVFEHSAHAAVDRSDLPATLAGGAKLGVEGTCPDCEATAVCAGHLLGDDDLDVWSISTRDRLLRDGRVLRAGVPFHERDGIGIE